jgi:hypothetical protein
MDNRESGTVRRMPSFSGIIQTALQTEPQGEIEWFEQLLAALDNGQIEDVKEAIEKAIKWKRENRR